MVPAELPGVAVAMTYFAGHRSIAREGTAHDHYLSGDRGRSGRAL